MTTQSAPRRVDSMLVWDNHACMPLTPPDASHRPPPALGEHTESILREAGFDDTRLAALRSSGCLG